MQVKVRLDSAGNQRVQPGIVEISTPVRGVGSGVGFAARERFVPKWGDGDLRLMIIGTHGAACEEQQAEHEARRGPKS